MSKVFAATWQRCRVQFASRRLRRHAQSPGPCRQAGPPRRRGLRPGRRRDRQDPWRKVAGQLRPKVHRLAGFMDEAENDVPACMTFPAAHRVKLHSTDSPGASTARPGAAPMSWASSPTNVPSSGWRAPSCSKRATNGPSSGPATCRSGQSPTSAMIPSPHCPPWRRCGQPGRAGDRGGGTEATPRGRTRSGGCSATYVDGPMASTFFALNDLVGLGHMSGLLARKHVRRPR